MRSKIILSCIALIIIVCSSCKSSQGHCDAYGNKSASVGQDDYDIHTFHNESMVKYVSSSTIK